MDPDITYDKIVELFNDHEAGRVPSGMAMEELAEHWQALDKWLKRGGFAPRKWDPARR